MNKKFLNFCNALIVLHSVSVIPATTSISPATPPVQEAFILLGKSLYETCKANSRETIVLGTTGLIALGMYKHPSTRETLLRSGLPAVVGLGVYRFVPNNVLGSLGSSLFAGLLTAGVMSWSYRNQVEVQLPNSFTSTNTHQVGTRDISQLLQSNPQSFPVGNNTLIQRFPEGMSLPMSSSAFASNTPPFNNTSHVISPHAQLQAVFPSDQQVATPLPVAFQHQPTNPAGQPQVASETTDGHSTTGRPTTFASSRSYWLSDLLRQIFS